MRKYIITLLTLIGQLTCLAQQAIDLGLSVAWADCNLGAERPKAVGNMLAWGELEPKSEYTLGTYLLGTGKYWHPTKYVCDSLASDAATPRLINHDNYKETPRSNGCAIRAVKDK